MQPAQWSRTCISPEVTSEQSVDAEAHRCLGNLVSGRSQMLGLGARLVLGSTKTKEAEEESGETVRVA